MSVDVQTQLIHAAVIDAGLDAVLQAVVPLVEGASARGDQVVVEASPPLVTALVDRLAASQVRAGLLRDLARHPHQMLWGMRQLVDDDLHEGNRVFMVHEIDVDEDLALRSEWGRAEALVNHVMRDCSLTLVCVYDTSAIDSDVLAQARATHPGLLPGDSGARNPHYQDTRDYLRRQDAGWASDPLEASPPDAKVGLADLSDLTRVRRELERLLVATTLRADRRDDFSAAVFEVTSNALLYGGSNQTVHLWRSGDRVLCRVRDEGPGPSDSLVGYEPPVPHRTTTGNGLWSARQLSDLMTTTHEPPGFTVRLSVEY